MNKYITAIFLLLISLIFIFVNHNQIFADNQEDLLILSNEFIEIVVNQQEDSKGRFYVKTTGGDPLSEDDENQHLLYGSSTYWPSFTTIKIDGEPYVFGGETTRRAGRNANYGEIIEPPHIDNDKIIVKTDFEGIVVTQILSIVKGSTTGFSDTARIEYEVQNTTEEIKEIGLRMMLDSKLGENDGAPFRIEDEAIETDYKLTRDKMPEFWQSFDSVDSPTVISQGTLRGSDVTIPDEIYFSNWGDLADGFWDFNFNPGREFLRDHFEIDSAMAMFWYPEELNPGESKSYITKYGLGGIDFIEGLLSLGVTSPAEVILERGQTIPIIAYIRNTSEIVAEGVNIELELPDEFTTTNKTRNLGDFDPGEEVNVSWNVRPVVDELPSSMVYKVIVDAENTDSNEIEREVKIAGPPDIEIDFEFEELKNVYGKLTPNPIKLKTIVRNIGGSNMYNTSVRIDLAPGIRLITKEKREKLIGTIRPGEEVNVFWNIKVLDGVSGRFPFAVNFSGFNDYYKIESDIINIPEVEPTIYMTYSKTEYKDNDYLVLNIKGNNLQRIDEIDLKLKYDNTHLKPLLILPGTIFVHNDRITLWEGTDFEKNNMINISEILPGREDPLSGDITSIIFKILHDELTSLKWGAGEFIDNDGQRISVNLKEFE